MPVASVTPQDGGGNQAPADQAQPAAPDANGHPQAAAPPDLSGVAAGYPGDNASSARIAAWMGHEAQRRGLPPELPVMAALVESNMKNLHYGDADSVGFFQMRLGIWNQGPYAGYQNHPEKQLKWFLDHAAEVQRQRIASGRSVKDPRQYGDWVADVERPRADYRGRYQLRLGEARSLLARSGSSGGSAARVMRAVSPGQSGQSN
jgi:hypothetical protein